MREIVVEPLGDVWTLRVAGAEPQAFRRGSAAENAARALATRLAQTGEQVELKLRLRDGRTGARFLCLPPLTEEEAPLLVGGPAVNFSRSEHDSGTA